MDGVAAYAMYAFLALISFIAAWWASQFEVKDDAPPKMARRYDEHRWFDGAMPLAIGVLLAVLLAGAMVWFSKGVDIGI